MQIDGRKLTREEFTQLVANYDFGSIPPSKLVVHHTYIPTKAQWKGQSTLLGIKGFYERKGWKSGPHLFVAEDGIWLFTPMFDVGTHAGAGNAGYKFGRLQWYSIGIEVVGDYDTKVWDGETKENVLHVIRTLRGKLGIENGDITFHRDWMPKSCPGSAITKEWLFQQLEKPELPDNGFNEVSPWAQEAWDWQMNMDLDRSVHPHQKVEAEWVFAILKKYHDRTSR